jgi:hypothetical protein
MNSSYFSDTSFYPSTLEKIYSMHIGGWSRFSEFYDFNISSFLDPVATKIFNIGLNCSASRTAYKRDIMLVNYDVADGILRELGIIREESV